MKDQYIHIDEYGNKFYHKDRKMTKRHRLDGRPAAEYAKGGKAWYVDGRPHRLDGPAVEGADGRKYWCVDGKCLTEVEFNALTSPTLELTLEEIAIKYGVDASKVKIVK